MIHLVILISRNSQEKKIHKKIKRSSCANNNRNFMPQKKKKRRNSIPIYISNLEPNGLYIYHHVIILRIKIYN